MVAYYNENDPFAAAWLRNLIAAGHIAPGDVDERSIVDVAPEEIRDYAQCHFFAGIGGWSYALRLAGWPDDRAVWTGSCPCQPLSVAGQRQGHADERHLWPAFYRLIAERRPATVFGEQVASADGREWLAGIRADLEAVGYAVGAADLCAAGVGAPHIRQRLYWLADATGARRDGPVGEPEGDPRDEARMRLLGSDGDALRLAHPDGGLAGDGDLQRGGQHGLVAPDGRVVGGMADPNREDRGGRGICGPGEGAGAGARPALERPQGLREDRHTGPPSSLWRDPDWLFCRDGRWRPVESGTFPLADGASARVGRLRAYGNAIVAPLAAEFIKASLEIG